MQTADVISPNDEEHIVRALSSYIRQGRNHNEALNSLNGVNNHSATLWKDYYLAHLKRIDELVSQEIARQERVLDVKEPHKGIAPPARVPSGSPPAEFIHGPY